MFATPTVGTGEVSDLVFFVLSRCPGPENGVLLALKKVTGKEEWRYEFSLFSWSTPTLLTDEDGHAYLLHGGIGGSGAPARGAHRARGRQAAARG